MTNENQREARRVTIYWVCLLLVLAWAFFQPQETQAQWTPTDASGNTGTTGSGNVGIGTATPTITGTNARGVHIASSGVSGLRLDTLAGGGRA